ncbi:MAG: putative DNA-binding domain-containing protein [Pseudomonadota bacterium]
MPRPAEAEGQAAMAAALFDPDRAGPGDARFAVHRNNVAAGLVEALGASYPAVKALVGARFFEAAALEFARAHPPRSPALIFWGSEFPDWIGAFPPAASLPWLRDVARLERAWREAYDAADAEPLAADALADLPPERLEGLRLRLHPSLRLVRSRHPAVSIWADVTGRAKRDVDMKRAETALVVRPGAEVTVSEPGPAMTAFVERLAAGAPLSAAAGAAAEHPGSDLGEHIADLFRLGLVAGLRTPEGDSHDPTRP